MKNFKRIRGPALPILLSLLVAFSGLTGCFRSSAGTAPVFPHETSDLSPDPALRTGILENGFRYVLLENSRPRDRVNLHLLVSAGSFHEKEEERGLAHYLEHMMFNGTTNFPPGELVKYFQSIGMSFGHDANASTGFLRTVYDLHLPSGDGDSLQQGLRVMDDYARGALLLDSEVDKERDVILAEKRTRDSVSYRTYKAEMEFELPGSRFIRRYPIGVKEVIQATDSELLRGYYDAWYRPENLILVMVGQFDADRAGELITNNFADMEARAPSRPVPDYGQTRHTGIKPLYHYEKEAGGTEVTIETLVQEPPPPDTVAERKRRLIRDMAYRILNYRLDKAADSPDSPFTSASAAAGRALRQYRYASVSADCVPDKWSASLTTLEKTLRTALRHGFTRAELDRVQKEVLAELDRSVKQKDTRQSSSLARGIMHHLFNDRVFLSPEQRQRLLAPVVNDATADKLHQALLETWRPSARLVMVTGNAGLEPEDGSPEDLIRSVFETSRAQVVTPPPEKDIPRFPYLPEPSQSGLIVSRATEDDIGVIRIDFANEVRLNLKKTDFKANQVRVKLGFGPGESGEPADNPALCELGASVINESGFGHMKKERLRQALAGKKASLSLSVAENRFYLDGQGASDEVALLFQLLQAFYDDFGCRQEARERVLAKYARKYDEFNHTIAGAMILSGARFFAGGDSRFGLPPELAAFEKISRDDIRGWMNRSLSQGPPEISVVGDFDPEEVINAAATYFGGRTRWHESQPLSSGYSDDRDPPSFPGGESLELEVPTRIDKALVNVAWPTDDYWDIRRNRRLNVLADIFNDRMRQSIREEAGQSYSQYAYNKASQAYDGYGSFHAVAQVAPDETEAVVAGIKAIAEDIITEGVTREELDRARDPILTSIKDMVETNGYWLSSVLSDSCRHPEKYDWSRNLMTDYVSITTEEINRLARQYLDNPDSAVLTIRPGGDDVAEPEEP
ncbi:MAG: insulinase family protein [Desulfosudaceae bacterium]